MGLHVTRRTINRLIRPALVGGFLFFTTPPAFPHDLLSRFIQHRVHLLADPRHIDVTIELTFFEDWSVSERLAMDKNHNGLIDRTEVDQYMKTISEEIHAVVSLSLAGKPTELIPLYDPRLDLLEESSTGRGHHRLNLYFFARHTGLKEGVDLVVEDRLWPEAPALLIPQAQGRGGCDVRALPMEDSMVPPLRDGTSRRLHFRCEPPPAIQVSAGVKPDVGGIQGQSTPIPSTQNPP